MEEWKEYNFTDITINYDKNRIPLSSKERETRKGEYRYFGAQGVIDYIDNYIFDGQYILLAEDGENLKSKKQSLVQFVSGKFWVNNHAHILTGNEKCYIKFLFYLLDSTDFTPFITGSAQPKLSQQSLSKIYLKLPPLPTQQKIAAILSSLDDKIELNNKINTNLEQQAQALFKNWFVDFEPFGGKMPEGWKIGKLSDIAEIKTDTFKPEQNPDIQVEHYSLPAFDEKRYPTFEISKELKSNKFIISNDEVLVSKLNPTVKRVWRPYCLTEKSICSTEFIVYKPISAELKDYLFSIVNSSEFNDFMCSNVTGSTNSHQRTPPKTTLNYEIPIPTKEILHKFCDIVTPMYDKIKENIKQNETVSSLRDTLLPKLMNGEIKTDCV